MNPNIEQIIKTIQGLPPIEQQKLRQWMDDKHLAAGTNGTSQMESLGSEISLLWLNENRPKYLGQWVALDGDRLIASGQTAKEVYSKAKAEGVKMPFVDLVQDEESAPFSGGWLS